MTEFYVQSGFNPFYPAEIETWKWNKDESPPNWVIDYCRVKNIDLDSRVILDYKRTSTGGVEIVRAGTDIYSTLLIQNPNTDFICFDHVSKKLFVLKQQELELLYKKK